jgi:hypothetical protein
MDFADTDYADMDFADTDYADTASKSTFGETYVQAPESKSRVGRLGSFD